MPDPIVRAVRPDEWRRMRAFRLEALRDEAAAVAFLATFAETAAHPDARWRERALAGSEQAGPAARQRSLVAVEGDAWVGTATVVVTETGQTDFTGRILGERTADVMAVYVPPSCRGRGIIQALLDAAAEWTVSKGLPELQLYVHAENPRAQRAYGKSGFAFTGEEIRLGDGERELRMVRALRA